MLNEIFLSRFDEAQIAQIKREQEIDKMIKTLPKEKSKLTYLEQRKLALTLMGKSDKDYLDLQNSRIILFDVEKIREAKKKYIEEEMSKIKDKNMTEEQKKLKVLNDMNSSSTFEIDEEKDKIIIIENNFSINSKANSSKDDSSKGVSDSQSTDISSFSSIKTSREFDETDQIAKDWIKLNFFDVFNIENILRKDSESILIKNKKEVNYAFVYHNNCTTTYDFAISKYFINKYLVKYELPNSEEEPRNENYDSKYGFCFCNKEIKEFNTTCSPNKMMCNECMKENMEIYGLNKIKTENNVLININGRVAFDHHKDGKFRCGGKFEFGKLYYNCYQKFTCKACRLLNEYTSKNYYKMK